MNYYYLIFLSHMLKYCKMEITRKISISRTKQTRTKKWNANRKLSNWAFIKFYIFFKISFVCIVKTKTENSFLNHFGKNIPLLFRFKSICLNLSSFEIIYLRIAFTIYFIFHMINIFTFYSYIDDLKAHVNVAFFKIRTQAINKWYFS